MVGVVNNLVISNRDYLEQRQQFVKICDLKCEYSCMNILCMPEGLVFGLKLFIM